MGNNCKYKLLITSPQNIVKSYADGSLTSGDYVFIIEHQSKRLCLTASSRELHQILVRLEEIFSLYFSVDNQFLFLVAPQKSPIGGVRFDGELTCLLCESKIFDEVFINSGPISTLRNLCFYIALSAMDMRHHLNFVVRTYRDLDPIITKEENVNSDFSLIIPHKGDLGHLYSCLRRIERCPSVPNEIRVYFDEKVGESHKSLIKEFPFVQYFRLTPTNNGPYVARNHCVKYSRADRICFQDSDDIPSFDRFKVLEDYSSNNPTIDMAGCHELRINEQNKVIEIFRFPIEVSAALKKSARHPLFHPTSFVKTNVFLRAGGFSTVRPFAADTQFLLRAYFYMKIKNINKFLYLRRKREGSLTTNPTTGLGSPAREFLHNCWREDFEAIKDGKIVLDESRLIPEMSGKSIHIEKL